MIIVASIQALKNQLQTWQRENVRMGFVPTMGHLHAGHIELVEQAKIDCDKVIVSIYVNPLQFNDTVDFVAYPKTLEADQQKLQNAGVDCLFLPTNDMMYPDGQANVTKVCVPEITRMLEGASRPGHFDGVSTVVLKLFNLLQPQVVFFGEKDYQQLLLIKKMVEDLNLPIDIQSVATYREANGLAMSSRNSRLSDVQIQLAAELYCTLQNVSQQVLSDERSLLDIEHSAIENLQNKGFEVDYISLRNCADLQPANKQAGGRMVLAAVRLGEVRLIDNLFID